MVFDEVDRWMLNCRCCFIVDCCGGVEFCSLYFVYYQWEGEIMEKKDVKDNSCHLIATWEFLHSYFTEIFKLYVVFG